ncbi:hypothetical protein AVEN_217739-1, partial [Araneus ventricosus]
MTSVYAQMEINHAFDPILEVLPEVTFKDEAAIPPHTGSSLAGKSGIFLPIYRNSDHPALRRSCVACAEDHHVSRTASTGSLPATLLGEERRRKSRMPHERE